MVELWVRVRNGVRVWVRFRVRAYSVEGKWRHVILVVGTSDDRANNISTFLQHFGKISEIWNQTFFRMFYLVSSFTALKEMPFFVFTNLGWFILCRSVGAAHDFRLHMTKVSGLRMWNNIRSVCSFIQSYLQEIGLEKVTHDMYQILPTVDSIWFVNSLNCEQPWM